MTNTICPHPEVLTTMVQANGWFLEQNLTDISHADSLARPRPAGNTLNWVVGHLVYWRRSMLELVDEEKPGPAGGWEIYDGRGEGARPWREAEARSLDDLRADFEASQEALLRALASDDSGERLATPWGESTVGDRLLKLLGHETYHVGQTGLQRRLLGLEGAI